MFLHSPGVRKWKYPHTKTYQQAWLHDGVDRIKQIIIKKSTHFQKVLPVVILQTSALTSI